MIQFDQNHYQKCLFRNYSDYTLLHQHHRHLNFQNMLHLVLAKKDHLLLIFFCWWDNSFLCLFLIWKSSALLHNFKASLIKFSYFLQITPQNYLNSTSHHQIKRIQIHHLPGCQALIQNRVHQLLIMALFWVFLSV